MNPTPCSRRTFLRLSGGVAVTLVMPRVLLGALAPVRVARRRTLVVVFLRGGIDGLNLVVPHADPDYRRWRPTLGVAAPGAEGGCLDLDGFFGLHPRAAALHPLFAEGRAVALHAVGWSGNSRSHFEEQDVWETATATDTIQSDGWCNRCLQSATGEGPIRAVAIGNTLPRILRGDAAGYAIRGLDDLALPANADRDRVGAALEQAYGAAGRGARAAEELLADAGQRTLQGMDKLRAVAGRKYEPAAPYPERNGFAAQLREVARLVKADVGLEIAEVDFGGWDTHQNQAGGAAGPYADRVQALASALAAFWADLGERQDDVLVLTQSEFGRTVRENGTNGTDHGWGNVVLALGAGVARGHAARGTRRPVLGTWPGLAEDRMQQGRDLRHTTDFRDIIAEAARVHLGVADPTPLVPGHVPAPVGFLA
jgi:uncharacterized protein (DUF1501 family)